MHGFRKVDAERILELRSKGMQPIVIAKRLGISIASVSKVFADDDTARAVKSTTRRRRKRRDVKNFMPVGVPEIPMLAKKLFDD